MEWRVGYCPLCGGPVEHVGRDPVSDAYRCPRCRVYISVSEMDEDVLHIAVATEEYVEG